jgi:hypothetical protein
MQNRAGSKDPSKSERIKVNQSGLAARKRKRAQKRQRRRPQMNRPPEQASDKGISIRGNPTESDRIRATGTPDRSHSAQKRRWRAALQNLSAMWMRRVTHQRLGVRNASSALGRKVGTESAFKSFKAFWKVWVFAPLCLRQDALAIGGQGP